jgi:hypothetical protein
MASLEMARSEEAEAMVASEWKEVPEVEVHST